VSTLINAFNSIPGLRIWPEYWTYIQPMDRLQNIETFVRVAQTQSFAEAARQLRVSKSVVTTRVKQLEDYLGAALFHRSTRLVRLSELGQQRG